LVVVCLGSLELPCDVDKDVVSAVDASASVVNRGASLDET